LEDFSDVRPFSPEASNLPIVMTIRSGEQYEFPIKGRRWERSGGGTIPEAPWDKISAAYLNHQEVRWAPISTYDASPLAWWLASESILRGEPSGYPFGKGFDTRGANGIFFVDLHGTTTQEGLIRVANRPRQGRSQNGQYPDERIANVNAALVVPAIRGRDVEAYRAIPSSYIILAHDPDERDRPLTGPEMLSDYRQTYNFLSSFRPWLLARSAYMQFTPSDDLWWHLAGVQRMDRGAYLVLVREIADPVVAAVAQETWNPQLGRVAMPVPDHKLSFYRTTVESEAYFLVGMINSRPLQVLLKRFANFTAISPQTLRNLPLPTFSSASALHVQLAELSKGAHAALGQDREELISRINEVAEMILASSN
jgi:hypothetical protein